ncbi:MAG: polysaccharide biosynthesis tyrosine autokinase [Solirubrobacterales bacterium]
MEPSLREQQQPDLRSLIQALWRRRWLFLGIVVSIPVAVYLISNLVPKTFEASSLVRLRAVSTDVAALTTPSATTVDTEALLIDTEKVAQEAAEELRGKESAGSVSESIETAPLTNAAGGTTDLLQLIAQTDDANRAAAIANAYASAIDIVRTEKTVKRINQSMARLEAESGDTADPAAQAELQRQLQLLLSARAGAEQNTEVIQEAVPPSSQLSPHPRRNTALAGLVSLLLALGAVAVRERLDSRLRDSTDLEPLLGVPLLSVIPRAAFPGARPNRGPVQEAFRTLASSLVYFNIERPVDTVVVASPTKGDGKTTVAINLAIALAKDGQRVVLIDADLRHPQVAVRLGIEPRAGLSEVLTKQVGLREALRNVDVGDGLLKVLAAGRPPPNPARLLGSRRMDSLLTELAKRTDVVVVDTPPILNVSDAVPLLQRVSGTVLVAKVGATSREALQRMRQVIETARGTTLGAVATGSAGAGLYGYGAEYYPDEVAEPASMPEPAISDAGQELAEPSPRLTAEPEAAPRPEPSVRGEASERRAGQVEMGEEREAAPDEEAALGQEAAPQEEAAPEQEQAPEEEAAPDEVVVPQEEAAPEEVAAEERPQEEAAPEEEQAPEEEAAPDEVVVPQEEAVPEEVAAEERPPEEAEGGRLGAGLRRRLRRRSSAAPPVENAPLDVPVAEAEEAAAPEEEQGAAEPTEADAPDVEDEPERGKPPKRRRRWWRRDRTDRQAGVEEEKLEEAVLEEEGSSERASTDSGALWEAYQPPWEHDGEIEPEPEDSDRSGTPVDEPSERLRD